MKNRCLSFFAALFALIITGCTTQLTKPEPGYAAFEYLKYSGNDPVYNSIVAEPDEYLNPILAGFYPDPSITRVGKDYYLVNSTFAFFPGIPVFHSTDLVNWEQIGSVLDRSTQVSFDSLGISQAVFAPAISYHDSIFYVVNTIVGGIGNFVVTAKDPAGPWSDPIQLPFEGIDPSLFFDDDGKAYMVNNGAPDYPPTYNGHRAIWMQEFDYDSMKMKGPRKVIIDGGSDISKKPIWIEGPHVYKVNGYYYLSAAEGGTFEDHSQVIFRSKNVWGPYIPWDKNPILTQRNLPADRPYPVTSTGHMDMVETQNGEWWAVFLGCTPYEHNYYNTGRQTFLLPVNWENNWPTVLKNLEEVPYKHSKPDLPEAEKASVPMNGNFTLTEEFNDTLLPLNFNFIRIPESKWYTIQNGKLLIKARNQSLSEVSQPSFIGRRQQHDYCEVETELQFEPTDNGDKAGLAVFQNEQHYYLLAITMKADEKHIVLEKSSPKGVVEITDSTVAQSDNPIQLRIKARGAYYDFYYSENDSVWNEIGTGLDARLLSTAEAGGFVGAYFGMYAYTEK